ncbi:MAG: iron ABC transporter permease [Gammaproteobacteria bacterium]|nr:iron ABC transporter permease [Gammaproteobacteria bacterium]
MPGDAVPRSVNWAAAVCLFAVVAMAAILAALCSGSVAVEPAQVIAALVHGGDDLMARIVLDLRLPRVLAGFTVGGLLALSGALMQVLLRNPLAEPYVLGISGGASAFALAAIALGLGSAWMHAGALAGALFSMFLVFALPRAGGNWDPLRVLLTGVVIAAGWGAVISFLLAVAPAAQVHGMLYWLMGDLGQARFSYWSLGLLGGAVILSLAMGRSLNLLVHGELQAAALGVSVAPVRGVVYFLASLTAAAAVMEAGSIGFVGLIIPHAVRLIVGADHRIVLPLCVLSGGTLLVIADALARTIVAPQQLPVGVLTAMLGVPAFLLLLRTMARAQRT